LRNPNDTLALEYICAAKELDLDLEFVAVKRVGVGHDSDFSFDSFCSASKIRSTLKTNDLLGVARFMPKPAFNILKEEYENGRISDLTKFRKTILMVLRATPKEDYKALPDISEGIENRLYNAARMCSDYDELLDFTATKRYTNARLRRLVLSAFLRMKQQDIPNTVPYIRVLAINENGNEILKKARGSSTLPIVMRGTSLKDDICFKFEERSTDIYSLTFSSPAPCGEEFTNGIITEK
jgi:predicted nucleotidyltransferase